MIFVGAGLIVCMIGVYFIRDIVTPVFLAITLVITARPLVLLLNRKGWPKWLSMLVGMVAVFVVLIFIMLAIVFALSQLITTLPQFADEAQAVIHNLAQWLASMGVSQETIQPLLQDLNFGRVIALLSAVLSQVTGTAIFFGTLLLFVAFVAVDMLDTSRQGATLQRVRPNLAAALSDFSWRVRSYWIVNTIFAFSVAVIDVGILLWLQIPLALTWGILSFVTSYIPNVGFIIGMIPPAIMALLAHDWQTMVTLILAYTAINFTSDMVIQPKVTADAVGLNISTTFVSLLFWSLLLGGMGAVLAVPLTLFFKCILFDLEPRTRWLSVFLGGTLDDAPPDDAPPDDSPPDDSPPDDSPPDAPPEAGPEADEVESPTSTPAVADPDESPPAT